MINKFKYSTLSNCVRRFKQKNIIVIGDLLLDQFIRGDVSRISPEAPVPVVWVKEEGFMPGGACNVACNIARLGANVELVGVVGDDAKSDVLSELLYQRNIRVDGVIKDKTRPTILKTRIIANHQQVVRIDREDTKNISVRDEERIVDYVKENIKKIDGLIIEDYGKGTITPSLLKKLVPLARRNKKIIAVDPKEDHFSYYKGISVITPNHHEAGKAVGYLLKDRKTLLKAGKQLLSKLNAGVVLITLGEEGMMVFQSGKDPRIIPAMAKEVFDVSGAGDTVIAVYTLSVVSGGSPIMAASIANCAASIVVGKAGVAVVDEKELLNGLKRKTGR